MKEMKGLKTDGGREFQIKKSSVAKAPNKQCSWCFQRMVSGVKDQ